MSKIILVSFADSKFRPTAKRLQKEAEDFGIFNSINIPSEKDFEKWYRRKYWFRLMQKGMGFWMWKSYLVKRYYSTLEEGDILFYVDAGCVLNINGKRLFEGYVDELERSNSSLLVFQQDYIEKDYTKPEVFQLLGVLNKKSITDSGQIYGGCFLLKKSICADEVVKKFYDVCHNYFGVLSDNRSDYQLPSSFVFHRYDQSVFSVIAKMNNPIIHSAKETYNATNWDLLIDYPVHAKRLKIYNTKYKILHRIKYPIRFFLNYMVVRNYIKF